MTTLTFNTCYSEDRFQAEIAGPVQKKFPSLTLEYRTEDPRLGDHAARWKKDGDSPDIQLWSVTSTMALLDSGACADLTPVSGEQSRFEQGLLHWGFGSSGEPLALPYSNAMEFPLFYNRDSFDEAGVAYPRDGMTWGGLVELACLLAEGKARRGLSGESLEVGDWSLLRMQHAASYLHPLTGEVALDRKAWMSIASIIHAVYGVPGNLPVDAKKLLGFSGRFVRDRKVAMAFICADCFEPSALDFRWDIVSYPSAPFRPFAPNVPRSLMLAITRTSKQKEAAAEVVAYLLSDEFQAQNGRNGVLSALNAADVQMQFGADVPLYEGKNIAAFTYHRIAMPPIPRSNTHVLELEMKIAANHIARRRLGEMAYLRQSPELAVANIEMDLQQAVARYRTELKTRADLKK